jgi:hypothetical protein
VVESEANPIPARGWRGREGRKALQATRDSADIRGVNLERDDDPASSLIAREKRQRRRLAALLDVSRLVASSLDPQAIFETVADKMNDLVGATEVTLRAEWLQPARRSIASKTGRHFIGRDPSVTRRSPERAAATVARRPRRRRASTAE